MVYDGGVVVSLTLAVHESRITRGDVVLDPDKLADPNLVLDVPAVGLDPR